MGVCDFAISKRILVSRRIYFFIIILVFIIKFSVSGSSATIYAYLGEFHNCTHRAKAIMWASVVFGITTGVIPLLAWQVINRSWSFAVPVLNIHFKPWRLFVIVCGLPSLISGLGLLPVPESPKYVLGQGHQEETIRILQQVYQINGGNRREHLTLQIDAIIEEQESVASRMKNFTTGTSSDGILFVLQSMWTQTVPLFKKGALKITVLASVLQFGIFSNSSGVYLWLPEVLNRMNSFMSENPGVKWRMCDIITATGKDLLSSTNGTQEVNLINHLADLNLLKNTIFYILLQVTCVLQLEPSTYGHGFILEVLYIVGFTLIALVVNRSGKFPLLCKKTPKILPFHPSDKYVSISQL